MKEIQSTIRYRVPMYDMDPMQVVWHGNYFNYFELARSELFTSRGIHLIEFAKDAGIVFPVVKSSARYTRPLEWRDEFTCTARLLDARHKIVVEFEIRRVSDQALCATGRTEQVAVDARTRELLYQIPKAIRDALSK
ncbi:MAG: acyl-CoA thioesterase [Deltaproteobacteria bacterium]|nr:acyl-CoA thioesterase [Deltaproteobacteria bacterium]